MQKTVQLHASFAKNLSRRICFWFLAIQFSVATIVVVFTASVNRSFIGIVTRLYVAINISTVVLASIASFVRLWRLQLDSMGVSKLLHAVITGVMIGTNLFCLADVNFSTLIPTFQVGTIFANFSSVCCSVVTVFAFLVDTERKGGFNLLLPTACPKVADSLRCLLSQNVISWSTTSLFVGMIVALGHQLMYSIYIRIFACIEIGNVCRYDNQQQMSGFTIASILGPVITSFFLRTFIEIGHCLLVTTLTYPLDFSKLDIMARSSNLVTSGEDSFLAEALAIGRANIGENDSSSHQPHSVSSSSDSRNSSSSSGSSSNGRVTVLPFSKEKTTLASALTSQNELSKKPTNSVLDIVASRRTATSSWSLASERQKAFKQGLYKSVQPRIDGPPLLPYFCTQRIGFLQYKEVLCRSLGFQDLRRILSSKDKVKNLFKANGKWPDIVFSCCGIVDAAAIQVVDDSLLLII